METKTQSQMAVEVIEQWMAKNSGGAMKFQLRMHDPDERYAIINVFAPSSAHEALFIIQVDTVQPYARLAVSEHDARRITQEWFDNLIRHRDTVYRYAKELEKVLPGYED